MTYKQGMNYQNQQRMVFEADNAFDIPEIAQLYRYDDCDFIPFNYAMSEKEPAGKGIHFFLDDYQFERVWNKPDNYIDMLRRYDYVLSPDFSLYTDFPKAMGVFNHFRKHWLAAYWQEHGINVIPTICWAGENSFDYCFLGEPKNSVVAVSSVGVCATGDEKQAFFCGYGEMLKRLNPSTILFFGKRIVFNDSIMPTNKIIYVEDAHMKRVKMLRRADRIKRILGR